MKKFNFYFDAKLTPRGAEIKVRDDCKHPKKGAADERYGTHLRQMEQKKEIFSRVLNSLSGDDNLATTMTLSKEITEIFKYWLE